MKGRKIFVSGLCIVIAAGLLAGCGGGEKGKTTQSSELIPEVTTDGTYPIDPDVELTYWMSNPVSLIRTA